jgi:hypothetical protein
MENIDILFTELNIDKELVSKFFIVFSRFEYALKRAGYVNGDENRVFANWDKFASGLSNKFDSALRLELAEAIQYLQSHPPKKQIVAKNELGWKETDLNLNEPQLIWLLRVIRVIRNNLFHGGKFPMRPVSDPSRDIQLIKSSLVILEACLDLEPKVQSYFLDKLE